MKTQYEQPEVLVETIKLEMSILSQDLVIDDEKDPW